MDLTSWLQVILVCSLGAISPGPSFFVVINNTKYGGYYDGVLTGVGHGLGIAIYASISIYGLNFLLLIIPNGIGLINWLGAIFLVFLGLSLWKDSFKVPKERLQSKSHTIFSGFIGGALIALLNPKVAIFFIAVFSQFVIPETSSEARLILVATATIIDMTWYILVATIFSDQRLTFFMLRYSNTFDRVVGTFFIWYATKTIF